MKSNAIAIALMLTAGAIAYALIVFAPNEQEDVIGRLLTMPVGGLYLDKQHNTVWSKVQSNGVTFIRIPDPEQAQLISNFSPANLNPPATPATSTTTLPDSGGRK